MHEVFHRLAASTARAVGSPLAFLIAITALVAWAISGLWFGFSDTWQLVINTATTIVTFLMVFLIQNTQNRDAVVIQLKLDELIRAIDAARNNMIDIESLTDQEIARLHEEFSRLRAKREAESHDAGEPS